MKIWKPTIYLANVAAFLSLTACEKPNIGTITQSLQPNTAENTTPSAQWLETENLKKLRQALSSQVDTYANENESDKSSKAQEIVSRNIEGEQCVTRTRHHNRNAVEEMSLYDINSDSLWVGSLVHAKEATHGVLNPIRSKRGPLTLSIQGRARHKDGKALRNAAYRMEAPATSEYENARIALVDTGFEPQGNFTCDVQDAYSAEQAYFNLKMDAKKPTISVKAEVESKTSSKGKLVTISCVQKFYVINLDDPGSKEAFFDPNQNVDDLMSSIPKDDSIAYVSSIHYGKRVIILVKTEESASSIQAKLNAKLEYPSVSATLASEAGKSNSFISSNYKVLAEGTSPDDIRAILGAGRSLETNPAIPIFARDSEDRLVTYGVPLAYNLRFLSNAKFMKIGMVGDYEVPEYIDPTIPVLKDVMLTVRIGNDDVDHDTAFSVNRPDGSGGVTPVWGKGNCDSCTLNSFSTHPIDLGDILATDLIGSWGIWMDPNGKDTVEYSITLSANKGRDILFTTPMDRIESRNTPVLKRLDLGFPFKKVYNSGCQLNPEEHEKKRKFEEKHPKSED